MERRRFLRGLGGAAIAAPFLGSVAERRAQGQETPAPRRLIVMFTHHGCLTDRWFPENSHGPLTADDLMGTSLEVLAPHVSKLLLPRGIRAMNEWTPDVSLGQGNDPHTQVLGTYFTCVPVVPNDSEPFNYDFSTKFIAKPTAPSLDHVCAAQVNSGVDPLYLRVSGEEENPYTAISYSAPEELFAGVGSPMAAFGSLTGLFTDGAMSPDSYKALRGKSALDLVRGDLETLERFDMSQADRRKLEAWKELLHETSGIITSPHCNAEVAELLALTDENLAAFDDRSGDTVSNEIVGNLDGADLHSNIAVLTALCDANRVIFLKYPALYVYEGLGMTLDGDEIAHRTGSYSMGGECVTDVNELILTIDRFYAEKFAYLVSQLDGFAEGDGTLLDNTATVWFQEFSDGAAFNLNNMPILQAGSCGGYFKTGYAVNVHDGSADLHRGNSQAACANGGELGFADLKLSGTPPEIGNAPINKYYCNLMNAIGVKAGSDGFPMPGGNEEVTHYGMYDETTDFVDGGVNEPSINDPGGFEELLANS